MGINDKEIDLVIVTHNHADHISGINEVLRRYSVKKLWISGAIHTTETYKNFLELVREKKIPTETVIAGARADFGELQGLVLTPFSAATGQMPDNQHDANIISLWQYGNQTLLLTGDGEASQEQELANRNLLRPLTILKVGHHGSNTSTSELLLEKTTPKIAVISLGKNNRYGHPHQSTLNKLANHNVPFLRTDQSGTIEFTIWSEGFSYKSEK